MAANNESNTSFNMWHVGLAGECYGYRQINLYNSVFSPSTVHCRNTYLSGFFGKYLIQRAFSVFKFNFPVNWDKDYALYTLFLGGFFSVINTKSFGVIPQECNITGYNVYYRPTEVLIANPLLNIPRALQIGKETELVRLQPDYCGIIDIITYIADNMALCAEACGVNVLNSKLSFAFATDDKAAAESYKKAYDNYASGQPMTVTGGKDLFGDDGKPNFVFFNNDVGGSYIVDKLMVALRQWELAFDNYVGIPNNPVNKKERVITSEVESNNIETRNLSDIWLETMNMCFEKVNKLFGLNLSVDYRYETVSQKDSTVEAQESDIRLRGDSN